MLDTNDEFLDIFSNALISFPENGEIKAMAKNKMSNINDLPAFAQNIYKKTPLTQTKPLANQGQNEILDTSKVNTKNAEKLFVDFRNEHTGQGILKVQTLTARRTFPVPNAFVTISKNFNSEKYIISVQKTDSSGLIKAVSLPTVPKSKSQTPEFKKPYTTYTIEVNHPDYTSMRFENVPMFDGVGATQIADLVLKSVSFPNGSPETIYVEEPQDL